MPPLPPRHPGLAAGAQDPQREADPRRARGLPAAWPTPLPAPAPPDGSRRSFPPDAAAEDLHPPAASDAVKREADFGQESQRGHLPSALRARREPGSGVSSAPRQLSVLAEAHPWPARVNI